ncbi:hypothetical protein RUM44_012493 [Polyplax serrata]|uniref:3',5'-cyclic-GMP phosphodiesterase n=1 Tax=Polyplax serrata TaxID=468196 RepID=A0ABR1BBH6_POLSC
MYLSKESVSQLMFQRKTPKKIVTPSKEARKVLAPFIKRLRKQGAQKLLSKVEADHQKHYVRSKVKDVIAKLQSFCKDSLEIPTVLNETAEILKDVTKSLGASSYFVDDSSEYLILNSKYMPSDGRHKVMYKIEPGQTVAAYVAYSQEFVIVDDILGDSRFPLGIPGGTKNIKSVLCLPILNTVEGKCIAVVELFRDVTQESYSSLDLQTCTTMTGWMGAAIYQNNERLFLLKKSELSNYLISLTEYFFTGEITFDKFVSDIVECAKLSVQAERGTFYVMDEEIKEGTENEIVADVYEEGFDSIHYTFKKKNKQKFTKNSPGFAGIVAREGCIVNIQDTNNDTRCTRIHDSHGSITKCVIGIPLKGTQGILGVLQLINKLEEPYFTAKDETLLKSIAVYSYLACQHNLVKEKLRKSVSKQFKNDNLKVKFPEKSGWPCRGRSFDWIITGNEDKAPNYAVFMFTYLLGEQYFDYYKLTEFVLVVRKSYRDNPYHNFSHAFTVCHCMFNIVHRNKDNFTRQQILALMIATICHDSDHVGFTNNFLELTNHWLSELYWESPLEHHHYDVCKMILESTELLSHLKPDELVEIDGMLKHLILSTDLVQYFRTRGQMSNLIKTGTFNWDDSDHRTLFLGIAMTVCDVSGQCKPFYTAKKITEGLYREFYNQGDVEKSLGFSPLSMMDREKTSTIPENQIQFLSLVCIPCVETLVTVFGNTHELLRQCQ